MTSPAEGIPLQDLLQNLDWVRGVARAVAGEAEADDLAQETWLRTAESPPQRIETVRAWLRRVLRNAHFEQRRTDARRREREAFATAGVETAALEAPDEIVARAEAQRRLVEALFELDAGSRQILILRYFQQWTPAQIASSLGEPAGTVRARLSRALARLRQRLGKEMGHREANLLIAGAAGLAKPTAAAVPLAAIAAGVCVVALTAIVLLNREESVAPVLPDTDALLTASAAGGEASPPVSAAAAVPEPPAAVTRAPARAAAHSAFTVRGRCVQDANGAPMAGVLLSVHTNSCRLAMPESCSGHARSETVTGADGAFQFSFDPPAEKFRIELAAAGWLPRHAYWNAVPAAAMEDFGEIRMLPGLTVSGRVEDASGQAVEGVVVMARDLPLALRQELSYVKHLTAQSDAQGAFTFLLPLPAGSWTLNVDRQGSVLLDPAFLVLPAGGQTEPLIVRVRQMPSVQGICVDEQGAPLAGVLVRGKLPTDRIARLNATSGPDGRFAVFARQERELSSTLTLEATARGRQNLIDPLERAWGDREITLSLRRAAALDVTVVEADSGQSVMEYTVFVKHVVEGGINYMPEKLPGPHSSGSATGALQIGTTVVTVAPVSDEWAVPPAQTVESDGTSPQNLRFELVPTGRLRVQILAGGQPVPEALVECFLPGSRPLTLADYPVLLRSEFAHQDPFSPNRTSFKECERTTDAAGLAELPTQPAAGARWLRLTGPFEHFVKEVAFDPAATEPIQIEVPGGCRFRGTLRSRWTQLPGTVLILCAEGARPGASYADRESHYYTLDLAEDGSFDRTGIRPGRYDLFLDYDPQEPFPAAGLSGISPNPMGPPLGSFTLQTGSDQPWTLEYPDREPGTVTLMVNLNGVPPADCTLGFWQEDEWSGRFVRGLTLTPEGSLTTDWLTPGSTRVHLLRMEPGSGRVLRSWIAAESLNVPAGQTVQQTLEFTDRRIRVRLLDRDGLTPLTGLDVEASSRVTQYELRSDADGWYEFDWVPQSPVEIAITGAGSDPWTAELSWAPEEIDVVRTLARP